MRWASKSGRGWVCGWLRRGVEHVSKNNLGQRVAISQPASQPAPPAVGCCVEVVSNNGRFRRTDGDLSHDKYQACTGQGWRQPGQFTLLHLRKTDSYISSARRAYAAYHYHYRNDVAINANFTISQLIRLSTILPPSSVSGPCCAGKPEESHPLLRRHRQHLQRVQCRHQCREAAS